MTGYNIAHGDTEAVRLDLYNTRLTRDAVAAILDESVTWAAGRWAGIEQAAARLRDYVAALDTRGREEFSEIADADLTGVDWAWIVIGELQERNLEAGRTLDEGLPDT